MTRNNDTGDEVNEINSLEDHNSSETSLHKGESSQGSSIDHDVNRCFFWKSESFPAQYEASTQNDMNFSKYHPTEYDKSAIQKA